ncbi:cysteine hydrolase [Bradyrhizobium manausense]|uniref:cysteine hydrolase family protein n=1 Tax=Bradyrhizobium manausense TaxID=989370 RepID=UPI001BAAFDB6|nr:isochorismatase family cysteine hydrolase [Bradyrhizobium manausense]MBR1091007.1 cysteine hydrolase [Bradyrhizobium manausense]
MQSATTAPTPGRALLLIDFQRDFIESSGRMPVARNQVASVLRAAAKAIADARRAGEFVLAIGNEFRPNDLFMNLLRRHASIAGSDGAKWTEKLPIDGAVYFPKWSGSAFVNPDLDKWLKEKSVTKLVLAGLQAKACVTATAKDALAKGYSVEVLADAIACVSDATRARALKRLQTKGITVLRDAG